MKTLFLIALCFVLIQTVSSQQKTEAYFGVQNRKDYAEDITECYDGGYIISAGFEYAYGWNIKTGKNFEFLWEKEFEFPSLPVYTKRVIYDSLGNLYVCGSVDSWPFVSKIDPCGNKLWCKILKNEEEFNYGYSRDILISSDNEIILLTWFDSDDEIDVIHLFGLDVSGNILWKRPYASRNDHSWIREPVCNSIVQGNSDYYVSGSCYWPYPNDTTHFFLRPLFICIDSLFDEKWILPFYAIDSIYGDAFKAIAINDTVLMGIGMRRLENPEESGLLMFFNKAGNELGYKEIKKEQIGPNVSQVYFTDICKINDSLYIAATPIGYDNIVFPAAEFIIDTSANIYNYSVHEGTIGNMNMYKTFDNYYVLTAGVEENKGDDDIYVYKIDENLQFVPFDSTAYTYDSLCPGGIQSGTIDLTDCFVWVDIGEAPSPKEYYASIQQIPVKAYPNPVNGGEITFEFGNTEHHKYMELQCFNIIGKKAHREKVYTGQGESKVDINGWSPGIYIAVIFSENRPVGRCKFVIN